MRGIEACVKGEKQNQMRGIYNRVENPVDINENRKSIQRELLTALVYFVEKGSHLLLNSCLCFDQNTPGIYPFTPAFDEKTPAFWRYSKLAVFVKMNSYFYLLISYLFLNLHNPLLGQNTLKRPFL